MGSYTVQNYPLWTKIVWLAMFVEVSFIICFKKNAKSHDKSDRLWTKNKSLARGLLALQMNTNLFQNAKILGKK